MLIYSVIFLYLLFLNIRPKNLLLFFKIFLIGYKLIIYIYIFKIINYLFMISSVLSSV